MPRVVDTQQRRAELTDATAHAIAKVGIENVTLREIARSGGWTTGIVNHYFADKRDLMRATFRSRADIARARVERSVEAGASLLEAIIDASLPLDAERLLNWKVWLAFWGAAVGDEELSAAQRERHATFLGSIEDALGAAVPCPSCGYRMVLRPYNYQYFVPVDKCLSCSKIWFDSDELEILQILIEDRASK